MHRNFNLHDFTYSIYRLPSHASGWHLCRRQVHFLPSPIPPPDLPQRDVPQCEPTKYLPVIVCHINMLVCVYVPAYPHRHGVPHTVPTLQHRDHHPEQSHMQRNTKSEQIILQRNVRFILKLTDGMTSISSSSSSL